MIHVITLLENRDGTGQCTHYTVLDTGKEIGIAMRISPIRFEFYPLESSGITVKSEKTMKELKKVIASALP